MVVGVVVVVWCSVWVDDDVCGVSSVGDAVGVGVGRVVSWGVGDGVLVSAVVVDAVDVSAVDVLTVAVPTVEGVAGGDRRGVALVSGEWLVVSVGIPVVSVGSEGLPSSDRPIQPAVTPTSAIVVLRMSDRRVVFNLPFVMFSESHGPGLAQSIVLDYDAYHMRRYSNICCGILFRCYWNNDE